MLPEILLLPLLAVVLLWAAILACHAPALYRLWREPVLRVPVLIIESDDWGPGPAAQAAALRALRDCLREFRDRSGAHPVMTLGLVLGIARAAPEAPQASHSVGEATLLEGEFDGLRALLDEGVRQGVFALQLHGRAHFWPAALAAAAREDPRVAGWLAGPDTWRTEDLPAGLQSRWAPVGGHGPWPLDPLEVRQAAREEAELFARVFGHPPVVAVPTTFVWNAHAEAGWAAGGVRRVVTPGRQHRARGAFDRPAGNALITNAMRAGGVSYLVRDAYFEPFKGHTAATALAQLERNTGLGRPTLLETHRINFLDEELRARSLGELRKLLREALARHPELRFMSSEELADLLDEASPAVVAGAFGERLACWRRRLRTLPRFWKLSRLSGLALLLEPPAAQAIA